VFEILLVTQKSLLGDGSAEGREAAEGAVGADDAVTRDDQGDGVLGQGGAYGAGGSGATRFVGQLGVASRLAERDLPAGDQGLSGKWAATDQVNGRISTEIGVFAFEVGHDMLLEGTGQVFLERDIQVGQVRVGQEGGAGPLSIADGQEGAAKGLGVEGEAEVAPARLEDRVPDWAAGHVMVSIP
jgi:hypothetical protein